MQLSLCGGDVANVEASLIRVGCPKLLLTVAPVQDTLQHFTVAIPDPLPPGVDFPSEGVWKLSVLTACGCYDMSVYVECPGPSAPGTHHITPGSEGWIECCLPDDALTFKVTSLSPLVVKAEGYPDAALLHSDAGYAVRLGVTAPSVQYHWTDANASVLASGTYGGQGTTLYHKIDITCATYALIPVVGE